MTIGERIKKLREIRGMTQEDLARAAGYTDRTSISKIESGKADPKQRSLVRLAAALNVRPSDLLATDNVTEEEFQSAEDARLNHQIVSLISEMSPSEKSLAIEVLKRFAGKSEP